MQLTRPAFARHPYRFGRGPVRTRHEDQTLQAPSISEDVKLFATTFLAGFLFVSIVIG